MGSADENDVHGTGIPNTGKLVPDTQPLISSFVPELEWRANTRLVYGGGLLSLFSMQNQVYKTCNRCYCFRAWVSLAWHYTCCKLAKASDQLIALSGIA